MEMENMLRAKESKADAQSHLSVGKLAFGNPMLQLSVATCF